MQLSCQNVKVNRRAEARRRILIILFSLFAIFQSGLRDLNNLPSGNDTPNYMTRYQEVLRTPWSTLFNQFDLYSSDYEDRDNGYPIFMKVTQVFSENFTFFMFVTAIVFMIPLGVIINKYVKSSLGIILSFLIFFALFLNIINCFMRQAITLAICMFALRYVLSRKWIKYFGLILIAFTIHTSSIIAAPLYFLPIFSKSRKWLFVALIASPVLIMISSMLLSYLVGSVYENYMSDDEFGSLSLVLLIYTVSVLTFLFFNKMNVDRNSNLIVSGVMGSFASLPFVYFGGTVGRVSYYYILVIIPLIPMIIDTVVLNKFLRLIIYAFSMSFFLYFIISINGK
jgi:hypothetical protein